MCFALHEKYYEDLPLLHRVKNDEFYQSTK